MKKKILLDYHRYLELVGNDKEKIGSDLPIQTGGFEEKPSQKEEGEGEEGKAPPTPQAPAPPPGEPEIKKYRKLDIFDKKISATWLDSWETFTVKKKKNVN